MFLSCTLLTGAKERNPAKPNSPRFFCSEFILLKCKLLDWVLYFVVLSRIRSEIIDEVESKSLNLILYLSLDNNGLELIESPT